MLYYHNNFKSRAGVFELGRFFSSRLAEFLSPFLLELDKILDSRLVATFEGLCSSIVRHRSRSTGLVLSELGGYLLSFDKAPAGTNEKGELKNAYRFSVGRKATSSKQVWDMHKRCYVKRSLLWMPCLHEYYQQHPLTLIICRPGKKGRQPWYLLTNALMKESPVMMMHGRWCMPMPEDGR